MRYYLTLLALLPLIAHAQIYQYVDPETGSTKLTNMTPRWYSASERRNGPRTLVIVGGNVVDDTNAPGDSATVKRAVAQKEQQYAEAAEQTLRNQAAQVGGDLRTNLADLTDQIKRSTSDPLAQGLMAAALTPALQRAAEQDQDTLRYNAQLEAQRRETLLRAK